MHAICFDLYARKHSQDAVWGAFSPGESHEITAEFVQKRVPFMSQCITETERRYPPAPGNFRGANESFERDGVKIKKGTQIFCQSCVHALCAPHNIRSVELMTRNIYT